MAKLSPLAYRYFVVESKTMSRAHSLQASHRIWLIGVGVGVLGAAPLGLPACNDFSPDVGTLRPSSGCTESVSPPSQSNPYGGTVVTCPDGGMANAVNVVEAGAGVTGNVLIADQLNNRVIVIDRAGKLLWQFGNGSASAGPRSIVQPNDAEFVKRPSGDEVLIASTGDDRILIVDYATGVPVWEYGGYGDDTGLGTSVRFGSRELKGPTSARLVPTSKGDHILISDQGNHRVIEVERATGNLFWQYKPQGQGLSPQSAERLANGHTLIADQGNGKEGGGQILEVEGTTASPSIFWLFPGDAGGNEALDAPAYASRFATGKTLVADTNNSRVIVVDSDPLPDGGRISWTYQTPEGGAPTGAVRLADGGTLITLMAQNLVIEVDATKNQNVVYLHGGGPGMMGNELSGPYNAKVTDDYTGITAPSLDGGSTGDH